jgi:hypothetical protein
MAKVTDNQENLDKCICGNCPTHNQCMRDNTEALFCARGKSACKFPKNGCLCGACPVASENGLEKMYYCEIGADE